ncbi:aspartate/glutamate racemase family protein [Virgibacillus ainsalahensis]
MMEDKKLGVLGGMGPVATSVYFEKVIEHTDADRDQDHIDMVILNHSTLPDRTEVIQEQKAERFLGAVKKDLEVLDQIGVSNIAIPCNTSHYFYNEMQEMTDANIINMIDETANYIYANHGANTKVGILATNGTINSGIYQKSIHAHNLQACIPSTTGQEKIMRTIYNVKEDKQVCSSEIESIMETLIHKEKCECIILGCTELSCIEWKDEIKPYCIDAMEVLVHRSIELSGKNIKPAVEYTSIAANI